MPTLALEMSRCTACPTSVASSLDSAAEIGGGGAVVEGDWGASEGARAEDGEGDAVAGAGGGPLAAETSPVSFVTETISMMAAPIAAAVSTTLPAVACFMIGQTAGKHRWLQVFAIYREPSEP